MIRRLPLLAALALAVLSAAARAQLPPVAVVFFVEWSGALDDVAHDIIQTAADAAKTSPDATLTVTGFADRKGSKQADIYLSELRAQVVVDALVTDGIAASRIKMAAAGAMPVTGVIGRRVEITLDAPAK